MAFDESILDGYEELEKDALLRQDKKPKKKKARKDSKKDLKRDSKKASEERGYRRLGDGGRGMGMKPKNGAVVTGVLFFAALIVLIYTMLEFRSQLLTVIGASACFLIMAAIVINQLSIAVKSYQKKQNLLIESRLIELQNRLLESSEESQDAAKMSAVYAKKINDGLAEFQEELINYQRKENVLMQRIISTQTKATKVLVKYNDMNTKRLVSSASNQYEQLEKSLDSSIQSTAEELRKIGETVAMIQQTPPPETITPEALQAQMAAMAEMMPKIQPEMEKAPAAEPPKAEPVREQAPTEEPSEASASVAPQAAETPEASAPAASQAAETPVAQPQAEPVKAAAPVKAAQPETAAVEMPADPNAQLSPDQIAALFASSGAEPAKAEPETPLQTASQTAAPVKAAQPETAAVEMPADPNAQLSPDQIAALFASSGTEPAKAEPETPAQTAAAVEMPADPNAQLSPDQIAALFASSGAEPAKAEPETPAPAMPEDPNAQLSPDQIAALFAAANG